MIVNDDSSIVNKWQVALIDDTRVIISDQSMFIVPATIQSNVVFTKVISKSVPVKTLCFG